MVNMEKKRVKYYVKDRDRKRVKGENCVYSYQANGRWKKERVQCRENYIQDVKWKHGW